MATDRRVTFLIGANVKNFTQGLNTAQRKMRRFGRKMERTGKSLTRNISAPLAAAGGMAVKAAGDFEDSFADIRKTVDTTEQQFDKISEGMRDMAKTIPTNVNELNRMGGVAGQLGIEAENIVDFTETLAKLGDTTDIAGEQAALSLSRFMNVMGTSQQDIDRLGSAIVGLGNNFAAMESEIVDIATSMAPLGNSIGLTEQQVLAFSTTIAASGGQARAASTAFQKTANTMKQAVLDGNEDLQTFAETAGMTASEFKQAFQQDSAQALQVFLEGLRRVQKEGGNMAAVLEEVGLADQRLIREFGKVVGNLDDLDAALGQANTDWERNTALTEEAQKRYKTFNSRVQVLWNNLKDLGITIGNTLMPVVDKLINASQKAINYLSGLNEETLRMGIVIAGVAAAIGPALILLGKLTAGIAALVSPVFLANTAITALFVGVVTTGQWMVDNWDKISQDFANALAFMRGKAAQMAKSVIGSIKSVINFVTMMAPPELLSGLFGIDLSEMAFDAAGVNNLIDSLDREMKQAGEKLGDGIRKSNMMEFTSLSESAMNALDLTKNTIINGLEGILNSSQIQGLLDEINSMVSVNADSDSGGGSSSAENPVSRVGISSSLGDTEVSGNLRRATGAMQEYDSVTETALGKTFEQMNNMRALGVALTDVANRFTDSFGRGMANVIVQGEKLADTLRNIGKLLMSSAIQKGISMFLTGGLSGVDGFFGSGGGLFGRIFGVNDALITSNGDVVKFHPNDNLLAMQDFSNLMPSMGMPATPAPVSAGSGGKQVIEIPVYLDGKEIYRNQKEVTRKMNR